MPEFTCKVLVQKARKESPVQLTLALLGLNEPKLTLPLCP